jgi:hypothetical protein
MPGFLYILTTPKDTSFISHLNIFLIEITNLVSGLLKMLLMLKNQSDLVTFFSCRVII